MRSAISILTAIVLLTLPAATPAAAGFFAPELAGNGPTASEARIMSAGYADDSTPGAHRGRRKHASGETTKAIEPPHADMNGATRESADKAYRKQYGF